MRKSWLPRIREALVGKVCKPAAKSAEDYDLVWERVGLLSYRLSLYHPLGIALSNPAVVANEDQSLVFTYMDGDPIQGQLTVDGTTSIPIRIYSNSKSIVSGLLRYSSTGRHSAHIALNSSHEQQEQEFDFWVERKPIAFKINLIPR